MTTFRDAPDVIAKGSEMPQGVEHLITIWPATWAHLEQGSEMLKGVEHN